MGRFHHPQKPYPHEFSEAVESLRTSGRPLAQLARHLGVDSPACIAPCLRHSRSDSG